jgi:hypothetical protein
VVVQVLRYESADAALADAARLVAEVDGDAIETFEVASVPGAIGTRFLALAWLFVAPIDRGPTIDQVVAVRGDTVAIVLEAGDLGPEHSLVTDLVRQFDERAGR